jgi:hypothetical protein
MAATNLDQWRAELDRLNADWCLAQIAGDVDEAARLQDQIRAHNAAHADVLLQEQIEGTQRDYAELQAIDPDALLPHQVAALARYNAIAGRR